MMAEKKVILHGRDIQTEKLTVMCQLHFLKCDYSALIYMSQEFLQEVVQ